MNRQDQVDEQQQDEYVTARVASCADGLTAAEVQLLRSAVLDANARAIYIWDGDELSDDMILQGAFAEGTWLGVAPPWAIIS